MRLRSAIAFAAVAALLCGAAGAEQSQICDAPFPLSHKDPLLQTALESALRRAGLSGALERRELGVALVDLTHTGRLYYAGVNDDHMLYAASLPKIGILLGVAEAVERGDIEWDEEFRYKLTKMITISDNGYATWGAELVGLRGLAEVMLDPRYCLYEGGVGGLWVGRPFKKGGESYRDPLKGISHGASPRQVARWYVMLDEGRLVTPAWSRKLIEWMAPPEYHHKFVKALGKKPGVRFVARKSGTWSKFHADSAIVQHGHRRYVLVGLAESAEGESMMHELAWIADDLVVDGGHRAWSGGGLPR